MIWPLQPHHLHPVGHHPGCRPNTGHMPSSSDGPDPGLRTRTYAHIPLAVAATHLKPLANAYLTQGHLHHLRYPHTHPYLLRLRLISVTIHTGHWTELKGHTLKLGAPPDCHRSHHQGCPHHPTNQHCHG